MRKLFTFLLACLLIATAYAKEARCDFIYTAEVTLTTSSGTDVLGFEGATFEFSAIFDCSTEYVESFALPAIVAEFSQVTVTGSDFDGTYFPGTDVAFYPSFSGIYSDPAGLNDIPLSIGGETVLFGFETETTASGSGAMIGNLPIASDFGPTTVLGPMVSTSRVIVDGGAVYDFTSSSVNVSRIPEPATATILISLAGTTLLRRRRG
ncbi:MAG: hypothetical protein AAF456_15235 [Planctomycetota bacterium]